MFNFHKGLTRRNRTEEDDGPDTTYVADNQAESNTDDYRRYTRYTILIFVWGLMVIAYLVVLEKAVHNYEFLGSRGSQARSRSFDALGFIRTGFATIHVPVMISVLASTVPAWTTVHPQSGVKESCATLNDATPRAETGHSVIQLFYLADKTWAGLIGWISTAYNSLFVERPSLLWLHLAIFAALTYAGFPLLSVAYITQSSQHWETQQIIAATSLGRLFSWSFEDKFAEMQDQSLWVGKGLFASSPNSSVSTGGLAIFNSSQMSPDSYRGLRNASFWAFGDSILTLPLAKSANVQLPVAALQVSTLCTSASYNNTVSIPSPGNGIQADLLFDFNQVNPKDHDGRPYVLSCRQQ